MAARTAAELAIEITAEARDATAGFDDVGQAARDMEREVASAGDTARETSRSLGISADAADDMAGKTGKATGALGALAGGLEAVGLEKYAAGLQGAAIATDFASGAGDALNLVMESTILKNIKAKIATVGSTIATVAQTVATTAMATAQWALNAALNANPISLIVIGVIAFVAAIILAYKKSETFRNIVNGAFRAVKNAAEFAFNWVKNNWPLLLAILTGPFGLAILAITKNWDKITAGAREVKRAIIDRFSEAGTALSNIAGRIKDALLAPFKAVLNAVQDILDLIGKIKLPDIKGGGVPFVPGVRLVTAGTQNTTDPYSRLIYSSLQQIIELLRGALSSSSTQTFDPYAFAALLNDLLYRYGRGTGPVTA